MWPPVQPLHFVDDETRNKGDHGRGERDVDDGLCTGNQ
jgi:hypothetical protein